MQEHFTFITFILYYEQKWPSKCKIISTLQSQQKAWIRDLHSVNKKQNE